MYLIGAEAVQWGLIGLAFYAAFRLFRSAIMDALGFRKSRREAKEAEALNENGLENLDEDPMSDTEQDAYVSDGESLAEYEGLDGEEPPDNMPDSPEDDPGLQYDLDQHNQEVYDNSPQWYRDLVDSGQFDEEPEPVGPPTREEMAINLISYDGAREMQDEDWEYVQVIAERLETESPEEVQEHLINLDLGIEELPEEPEDILESEEEN